MTTPNEEQSQADNVTMSGGGLYSLATIGAKDVIDLATPDVLDAVASLSADGEEHWSFTDMGCADGGTSLDLWRSVVNQIRSVEENNKEKVRDIQIVYADQARNDFNALVGILHGLTDFKTYLNEHSHVHALESGSSFYLPILPANSLHLGFSATAMHWLRQKPCDISNHVHMVGAADEELEAFSQQAAEDWETLLLHRARELKEGGKLVLVNFCRNEKGQYLGNTGGVNMFDQFNNNWRDFLAKGKITAEEYKAMTLPQYYNTVDEFSRPFADKSSAVYQAGLRLDSIRTGVVACPFAEDFNRHGDAKKFAREYIPTIRTWNESIFSGALSDERSAADRKALIESYYGMYQQQVEMTPHEHGMGYVHAYMTISKCQP